jgi:hypothetical protein
MQLSWPADQICWHLEAQTNSVATVLGTNWSIVSGTSGTNLHLLLFDTSNTSVFLRLVYP